MRAEGVCAVIAMVIAVVAAGCGGGGRAAAPPPRVAAAASLAEVARELCGDRAELSLGATSTLARQIAAGSGAEILLAAHPQWVNDLERRGLVVARRELCRNRLVLIGGARTPPVAWNDLARAGGRIAVGDPTHVPAGIYARQALEAAGLWAAVRGRLVPAGDVRAALAYVERGACELGIVYATDVRAAGDRVRVLAAVPECDAAPIRYQAALLRGHGEAAARLYAVLTGGAAARILARHGFLPPGTGGGATGGLR